jgi:DNA-binding NtrC family response regulator
MLEEQDSQKVLFIGDDSFILNNLICELFKDENISVVFAPTWDNGIKCMKNNRLKLVIIDSNLISKLRPSAVIPFIKRSKAVFFIINVVPNTWVYKMADRLKSNSIVIYKRPLNVDKFIRSAKKIWKKK